CWRRSTRGNYPAPRSARFRPSCRTSTPRFRRPTPRQTAAARSAVRLPLTNLATLAAVPGTLPEGITAANAPHANLAEIGAIFNDAADKILSGVNDTN